MATKHEQWKQRVWKARVPAYFKGLLLDASVRKEEKTLFFEGFTKGFEKNH